MKLTIGKAILIFIMFISTVNYIVYVNIYDISPFLHVSLEHRIYTFITNITSIFTLLISFMLLIAMIVIHWDDEL